MAVEIIIIVLLSILLAISTFITTKGKLTDERRIGFHSLKKNGWRVIVINTTLNPQKVINNSSQDIVYKYFTQHLAAEKFHLF